MLVIEREKQLQFEKEKLEMKLEYEKKSEEFKKGKQGEPRVSHAKLLKLTITKFGGTFEQWLPFWNKFCVEIDATDLPPVTKFSYLKELVLPKVRADIDGLPFNTEGYQRAKNTLKSEYGKTSEMSPGKEIDISSMLLTQTATTDYEELCKLDALGIQDEREQADEYDEFKEQLHRSAEGWYETGLPWKGKHPSLPNNKAGSIKRLDSTVRKLEKQGLLGQYDAII